MNSQKNTKRSESNNTKSTFYITTAIDYATGTPHIGHAYEKIATDVIARSKRLEGKDVFFLTGTDEHGQKVFEKAQENNKKVQDFVDEQTQKFIDLTKTLNLSNDFFIRTTDLQHKQFVQLMLQKAYDNGDIYLDEYNGLYCVGCEKYYGEDELIEIDGTSHMCPIHKTQCRSVKQQNYFFRLSKYQDFLLELYEKNPKFISPSSRREEIINRVKGGLRDLSISRPKETLTWGIEFPFDTTHVTYVWFDALFNYLSATKYMELSAFEGHWPADIHVIGADISWFHMVYWPAFLKSCGFELPNTVHAHGMILDKDGHKMSKSLGNVVDPIDEIKKYGLDEFRYYSMSLGSFGDDCRYSHAEFEQTIINDLNNDLGNLVSRVHTMVQKYVGGTLRTLDENTLEEVDIEVFNSLDIKEEYMSLIDSFEIHKAIQLVWSRIRDLNAYINQTEPFKVEDERRREVIMQVLVNSLYNLTSFISIVMPQKSQFLAQQLGFEVKENLEFSYLDTEIKLGEKVQLFENLSKKKDEKTQENNNSQNKDEKQKSPLTILDESRVEIKAILFDFDGVLTDNYKTVYEANNLAYNLSEEKFKDLFDGNPITGFKEAFEESKVKDFYEYLDEATKEMKVEKKVKKELTELQKKYSLYCITSNLKKNIELVLQNSELENSVFEEILCGDFNSCKEQKINHILEQYNLQKDEVVFVTDTLGDLKEANRAGVKTIAIDFGFHERERLEKGAPYTIVSSFKQIRRAVDALEKFTQQRISINYNNNNNNNNDKDKEKLTINAYLTKQHPTRENSKIAVFVHGFRGDAHGCMFDEWKNYLLEAGYDTLSFDFLGCGQSSSYPLSISSQQDQLEQILTILTQEYKYLEIILIGHSLGGLHTLLMKNSNKNPNISKKILIAPLTHPRSKEKVYEVSNVFSEQIEELREKGECTIKHPHKEEFHRIDKKLIGEFTQISTKKLQKIVNSEQVPILVIQGGNDLLVTKEESEVFVNGIESSICKYSFHQDAYHRFQDNTLEVNEYFYSEIISFIKYGIPVKPPSFTDLCLQVGTIISVENHPDADALYVEQVDFGENDGVRQIVSGLKKYFTKEEMVGKQVLAVTNLQTAKLRGVDSQGMLLLAENEEGKLSFIEPEENVENGSYVSLNIEDEVQVANTSNTITVDEFFKHSLQAVEGGVVYRNLGKEKNILNIQTSQGLVKLISSKRVYGIIR